MNQYKIAIPQENGQVNQHFGQSRSFAIAKINDQEVVDVESVSALGLAHEHKGLAEFLKGQGVVAVVVGGIGNGAASALIDAGLALFTGASGKVEEVANLVAKGQFVSSPSTCNHGGCGGHHHH